ncbi:hypothetical protein V492_01859 [Pseudogymnoascus sp. VKM F-4246]|nr:hypothetical protein V492_01859 [Pseudogymnoascus sp. VKM F-4246]
MPSLSACSPSDGNSQGASKNGDLIIDSVPILSDPAFADIGEAYFNWDGPQIDLAAASPRLNKWELLAGLQALSIYLLIRLDEGETEQTNLDSLLLATVTILSKRFSHGDITRDTQQALPTADSEVPWENWLFEESRRRLGPYLLPYNEQNSWRLKLNLRLCVVYQVINMLVYFDPAELCDLQKDLVLAPLPAKKRLWEADNEFMWKMENEIDPWAQTNYGLARNGELVKLDKSDIYCNDKVLPYELSGSPSSTASWEEWCSGMDGLGGLVILTASLIV